MKWLTTKPYSELTKEEIEEELKHLLLICQSKNEFEEECKARFGGPKIETVIWTRYIGRGARIVINQNGEEMKVFASVS